MVRYKLSNGFRRNIFSDDLIFFVLIKNALKKTTEFVL